MKKDMLNPYVGPRAFHIGEPLYGRRREVRDLLNQLIPDRIVLLYSPSGAGKTSLIQAGLIPVLREEGFQDQPILRVGLEPPSELEKLGQPAINRYVLSVLLSLEEAVPEELRSDLSALSHQTLDAYVDQLQHKLGPAANLFLIFDQFEEVITLDPTDKDVKLCFFRQLGRTLDNPQRWALFSMREDHVAALDSFLKWLPTRLANRFRLDLLAPEAARSAIREPAQRSGVEFTEAAAVKLIDDLRRLRVQHPDGSIEELLGPTIEPVQLQVVCHRLWERRRSESSGISEDDLRDFGNLDTALRAYYADSVERAAVRHKLPERRIRDWIEKRLISSNGLRTQILRDPAGAVLPDELIEALVDDHLLRAERRRHVTWLELSHDRLIEPINADNQAWRKVHSSLLEQQATIWQEQSGRDEFLLDGKALEEAERWAKANAELLGEREREFLMRARQKFEIRKSKRQKTITYLAVSASLLLIALLAVTIGSYVKVWKANTQSRSREIGLYASLNMEQPDLAALLAIQAGSMSVETEGRFSLLHVLENHPHLLSQLHGHTKKILSVAFSPSGERLATAGEDGIRLWDPETRRHEGQLTNEDARETLDLVFHPHGDLLASIHSDGSCWLWDLRRNQKISRPKSDDDIYASTIDFHPEGHLLAVGGRKWDDELEKFESKVIFYSSETFQKLDELPLSHRSVRDIAFRPDGRLLASAGDDSQLKIWDLATKKELYSLTGHEQPIADLDFSPDGEFLVSASEDNTVRAWRISEGSASMIGLYRHDADVWSVAFDHTGRYLISGSRDHSLQLWDFKRKLQLATFEGHGDQVHSVAFSPDSKVVVSGSADKKAFLWRLDGELPLNQFRSMESTLRFEKNGQLVTALTANGVLNSWNVGSRKSSGGKTLGETRVGGARLSQDGKTLALIALPEFSLLGHEVVLWNRDTWQTRGRLTHPREAGVAALAFSPSAHYLASAATDGRVRLWDILSSQLLEVSVNKNEAQICALEIAPDDRTLVSGYFNGDILVWDLDPFKFRGRLDVGTEKRKGACSVAFHPGSHILATGDFESNLTFWDLDTMRVLDEIPDAHLGRPSKKISSLAFSADGTLLASGGWRSILLWDVESRRRVGPALQAHELEVTDLAFSPSGRHLASSSYDSIMLWDFDLDSWQERACEIANRNLTLAEWRLYVGPDLDYRLLCPNLPGPTEVHH